MEVEIEVGCVLLNVTPEDATNTPASTDANTTTTNTPTPPAALASHSLLLRAFARDHGAPVIYF